MRALKVKVVGDSNVGKTSLLSRIYCENSSSEDANQLVSATIPPVLDSYLINMIIDHENYVVTFWDTCTMRSSDEFDLSKVRPLEYKETDVFLACFDISSPNSFQNISTVWAPELKHYMPGTPMIVVGNKMDLRSNG
jgi:small GTP-binding protein